MSGDLRALVGAMIIVITVRWGFTFWLILSVYGVPRPRVSPVLQRRILTYAFPLLITALLDVLTVNIDKYIVSHFFSRREFAVYALGAIEVPLIFLIISAVTSVMIPEMAKTNDRGRLEYLLRVVSGRLALLLWPMFFLGVAAADYVIPLLFSIRYEETIPIFVIYLFLIPQRALNIFPILLTKGLKRHIIIGRLIDLVVNIGGALLLMPFVGLWGPAIAVVVATYANKIYFIVIARRELGLRVSRIAPWRYLTGLTIFHAALMGVFFWLRASIVSPHLGFAAAIVVCGAAWLGLAWFERGRKF
jgi:O-antigen/teichoic acid export membrane protein